MARSKLGEGLQVLAGLRGDLQIAQALFARAGDIVHAHHPAQVERQVCHQVFGKAFGQISVVGGGVGLQQAFGIDV